MNQALEWKEKGNEYAKIKKYQEALDCYTKAIEYDSTNEVFYSNRSLMHNNLGHFQKAIEDAEKALSLKPDYTKAYLRKGNALEGLKKYQEAFNAYKTGLEVDPNDAQLSQALKDLNRDGIDFNKLNKNWEERKKPEQKNVDIKIYHKEIKHEDKICSCEIKIEKKDIINLAISEDGILKFKGEIKLDNIYSQIPVLKSYNFQEILDIILDLNLDKFNINKVDDKYKLDIAIKIVKKEKHLLIDLDEAKETLEETIKRLRASIAQEDDKIKSLEKEKEYLQRYLQNKFGKNKSSEIKEEDNEFNFDITKYTYEKEFDCGNEKQSTLLILKNGRISLGTFKSPMYYSSRDTGISIYEPNSLKFCYFIQGYGQHQIQLANGNLVAGGQEKYAILKLNKDTHEIIQIFKTSPDVIIGMTNLPNGHYAIYFKDKINIYNESTYELIDSIKLKDVNICKIIPIKDVEIAILSNYKNINCGIIFYDYVSRIIFKKIITLFDSDYKNVAKKISNNLLAIGSKNVIHLYDINKHEKIKSVQIFENKMSHNIYCIYPIKNKFLLIYHKDSFSASTINQYKITENDLIPMEEKKNFQFENILFDMSLLKSNRFIFLQNSGALSTWSQTEFKENEVDEEIIDEKEEEVKIEKGDENKYSENNFRITSLTNEKLIEKMDNCYSTLIILNDGRISGGVSQSNLTYDFPERVPTGFIIFEANTYKLSFCINKCGPEQIQLRNGHLVVTSGETYCLDILELMEKSYNKLQKIDIYGSPCLFGQHPNGNFTTLSEESSHDFWLNLYQQKEQKYIRLSGTFGKCIHGRCWYIQILNDNLVLYNYNQNGFHICDISTKEVIKKIEFNEGIEIDKFDRYSSYEPIVKITDNLIGMICSTNICIFNIEKWQITRTIQIINNVDDYYISCLLQFDELNLIVSYMDTKQRDCYLYQYEIQENGEKLVSEKKLSSLRAYKIMRKIDDNKLMLLSNHGKLIILSKDKI